MGQVNSRRDFLKASTSLAVSAGLAPWYLGSQSQANNFRSPSEQPTIAFIGTGIRYHTYLARAAMEFGPCAAICDVDAIQAGRAVQVGKDQNREHGHSPLVPFYEDYRRVLDRNDIDVVVIATPDHWHTKIAIEAMQAGKDVYCEKPLTLTIREGQQMLEVMNRTKRVVQVGTQQRTEMEKRFATAAAMVRDGRIGKVKRVTCAIGAADVCDSLPLAKVPKVLNWDMWQGQAPKAEYRQGKIIHLDGWGAGFPLGRTHRHYRWFYEYAGGRVTDWGAHHLDIAMWALDKLHADIGNITIKPLFAKHPVPLVNGMPTEDDRFNTASELEVRVTFADGIEMMIVHDAQENHGFGNGILFQGQKGRFLVNRGKLVGGPVEQLKENPLPQDALTKLYGCDVPESHMLNFMECIKTRNKPVSDVESHHRMLSVCHAVNVALRLDREQVYDPKTEQFVGDAQSNTFVEREQRKGFEIKT